MKVETGKEPQRAGNKPPRNRACVWTKVDWSRTNKDIANEFGVSVGRVATCRKTYAPKAFKSRRWREVFKQVDWSKPTTKIAEETGRPVTQVTWWRKIHAPETVGKVHGKHRKHSSIPSKWDSVDWGLKDRAIATQLGVTRQAVTSQRKNRRILER